MTSEKAMYWVAVGALALGAVNGFVTRLGESVPQLADRSVAIVTQASEAARNLAEITGPTMRGDGQDFDFPQMAEMQVRAQTRLACIQAAEVRNQAAMARMQAQRIRASMPEHGPGSITWPGGHIVIEGPQVQVEQDETF